MRVISTLLLITLIFLLKQTFAQEQGINHNFKIAGLTSIANLTSFASVKIVEYDPQSPDHLYVSFFDASDKIVTKTRFLFKKKKFELVKAGEYVVANDMVLDGAHVCFFDGGSVDRELIYKNGILQQETAFYRGGTKKSVVCGDDQTKNGAFKMWHPNGQLRFSGEYANNQKNGEFQQFDESGKLTRKGEYQQGKLVSGDPVVPDIMYKNPEIKAEYSKAKSDLNDQLRAKFDTLKKPEGIYVQAAKLNLVIDKSGKVIQVQKTPGCEPVFFAVSNALLKDLSGFTPGKVENVPVDSELIMEFQLSPQRFAVVTDEPPLSLSQESEANSENPQKVYTIVEQVPEYPGGLLGLRKFIAMNVRYPVEALEKGMVGKVFVSFVIDETGEVTNIKLARGVHPSLDQEAIRVVKLMDRWKPGIKDGKSVKVSYTVPINFDIQISEPR